MMERVHVRIGRGGPRSTCGVSRTLSQDVQFLRSAFGISHNRANALVNQLSESGSGSTQELWLYLTYEQLGRYTALRRAEEDLHKYWRYPLVIEVLEDPPSEYPQPIELRPGKRR